MTTTDTKTAAVSRPIPPWAAAGIGVAATVALWWLAVATVLSGVGAAADGTGGAIPTPGEVLGQLAGDGAGFYWPNLAVTVLEASAGYFWGYISALLLCKTSARP